LTFTEQWDEKQKERKRKQDELIIIYYIFMGLFLVFTFISIFLLLKAPFTLRRSLADACQEIPYDDTIKPE
jgi:hypothetical protein